MMHQTKIRTTDRSAWPGWSVIVAAVIIADGRAIRDRRPPGIRRETLSATASRHPKVTATAVLTIGAHLCCPDRWHKLDPIRKLAKVLAPQLTDPGGINGQIDQQKAKQAL